MSTYDVSDVAGVLREARTSGGSFPNYARTLVWWGAGCSVTGGIPASAGIVSLIEKKYPRDFARTNPKKYMHLMRMLSLEQRLQLIADMVEGASLNWAHIALAHLIKEGYINRVLTTNFDPLIEHACNLLSLTSQVVRFN